MEKKILFSFGIIALITLYLFISGMKESVSFYITPKEFFQNIQKYEDKKLKIGGFVSELQQNGLNYLFTLTDGSFSISVTFVGVPPDLFGKAKGAIVEGKWDKNKKIFVAEKIMAKHSEDYKPPSY